MKVVGYYKRSANRFSNVDRDDRRPLQRNTKFADGHALPFNEVMESFRTFVRVYKHHNIPVEAQVKLFVEKYERVRDYKDIILQRALKEAEGKE
jgi:hypothetical protein